MISSSQNRTRRSWWPSRCWSIRLYHFIEDEVSFRLRDVLDIPEEEITPEIEKACVEYLKNNSDVLFNYDAIDDALRTIVDEYGSD